MQIILDCLHTLIAPILCTLQKNNTLLKRTYVAYVSMATKYPIIKIVICANYENIGHKLLGPLKEGGGSGAMCYVQNSLAC